MATPTEEVGEPHARAIYHAELLEMAPPGHPQPPYLRQRWEAYVCPHTGGRWFWCPETRRALYSATPTDGWRRYAYYCFGDDGHTPYTTQYWWHQPETGAAFREIDAVQAAHAATEALLRSQREEAMARWNNMDLPGRSPG